MEYIVIIIYGGNAIMHTFFAVKFGDPGWTNCCIQIWLFTLILAINKI